VPDFQTITVSTNTTLSSSLEDGCYLIVFTANATVTIPAYTTGKNLVFRFANFGVGACTIQQASGGTRLYEFGDYGVTGVNSVTISSGVTRTFHLWAVGSTVGLNYWTEANPSTSGGVSTLGALTDVDVTGAVDTNVLKYNSTSGDWEDGAVAYSEVTGTPTLATVATTGAYSDLSGTPTLGTAAAEDVGTSANNVVQLDGSARLPAVDGSQLINLPSGASTLGALTDVTITTPANGQALIYNGGTWANGTVGATVALNTANPSTSPYNITSSTSFLETWIFNPSVTLTVNIPAPSAAGSGYRYNIKNISTQTITIIPGSGSIDGAGSVVINVQYASVTLVSDGANWFIV
jgi:hypothetical protein